MGSIKMKNTNGLTGKSIVAALGAVSLNVIAQTPPGAIPVGPLMAYPEIEVGYKRDSNIAIQPTATRRADNIFSVKPSVRLEAKDGVNIYDIGYRGEYLRYDKQTTDNIENHDVTGNGNITFDARNNLKLRAQYSDRFDPRGTLNIIATPTPNQYHQSLLNGLYTYGAEDAQGKLEVQGSYTTKRYVSNRVSTAALDNNNSLIGGTFLWRVQPKTFATFTARQVYNDYVTSGVTLDSKDNFYLVGVRWDATALTSGRFSIGRQTKKFEGAGIAAGRSNYSGGSWEGGVNWKPLSYSTVDFSTNRATAESTGLGNYSIATNSQASWNHAWTSSVSTVLSASYATNKFQAAPVVAAGNADRLDKTTNFGLRVNYALQRWLKTGVDLTNTVRDSNDNNFDYKRNQIMIFLAATL